jgi:hypothetical protein
MGNQINRPEIKSSSSSGIGISKRFSPTTNTNLIFVALKYGTASQKLAHYHIPWRCNLSGSCKKRGSDIEKGGYGAL